jgi:hypothetical protein
VLADTPVADTLVADMPVLAGRTTVAPGGSEAIFARPSAFFSAAENPDTVVLPAIQVPSVLFISACMAVIASISSCDTNSQSEFAETVQVRANMITIVVMYVTIALVICLYPHCPFCGFYPRCAMQLIAWLASSPSAYLIMIIIITRISYIWIFFIFKLS